MVAVMVVAQLPRVHLVAEVAVSTTESIVLTPKDHRTPMHSFLTTNMIAGSGLLIVVIIITRVDMMIGQIDIEANVMIEVEVTGHTETRANLDDVMEGIDPMVGTMKTSMALEEDRENLQRILKMSEDRIIAIAIVLIEMPNLGL